MDTEEEMHHFRIKRESFKAPRTHKTQEESNATDEAFMSYTYAEKAAIRIQQTFRQNKLKRLKEAEKEQDSELETEIETCAADTTKGADMTHRYAVVFMALVAIIQFVRKFVSCCSNNGAGDAQDGVRETIVEGGVEGIDTFGSMAVQAASSAGDGTNWFSSPRIDASSGFRYSD